MAVDLSNKTQSLIEQQMRRLGFESADALISFALQTVEQAGEVEMQRDDAEILASICAAEEQLERGEDRRWEVVRAELQAKYLESF